MDTITEEYKSSLNDLNFNSKPLISMLTMLADENKKHASLIVNAIINHINSVSFESKLPGLYLVDSIIKNVGQEYLKIFSEHITSLFSSVFEKVDENTRSLMFKLRQTWTDILPNKVLYNLDALVKKMDPAWPITAKCPVWPITPKNPSKCILINPKILDGSVEQKPESTAAKVTAKKEENKIKQQQGEVLKQLLAKQEQLRQLELKKLQLTMKKKAAATGITGSSINPAKQNQVRDPRLLKTNNADQNAPGPKKPPNSILPGKLASNFDVVPVSSISIQEKTIKSEVQSSVNDGKNNAINSSSVHNIEVSNEQPMFQKKVSLKNKHYKVAPTRNKVNVLKHKMEARCISKESLVNPISSNASCKNELNLAKPNEKFRKELSIGLKNFSKKNKNKISQDSVNECNDTSKNKVPCFSKQNEKLKSLSILYAAINKDKKHNSVTRGKHVSPETVKTKKNIVKPNETGDVSKAVLKIDNSPKIESECDAKSTSHNYKDLKTNFAPLNEETRSKRVVKHEIVDSDFDIERNEQPPPRKKNKSEDTENCNLEYRNHSPVLFGNEDQDLRQSKNQDVKSKDWSQYKESHPDKFIIDPGRQEHYARKFRSQKFHSSDFHHPSKYYRGSSFRSSRGRNTSRWNVPRIYFPRNFRGRYLHNSPIDSIAFDSHTFLQQAEEKYTSGRISEMEYLDLRQDLQKMARTSDFQYFADQRQNNQNFDHHKRNQENQKMKEGFKDEAYPRDNLRIQEPFMNLPGVKPFVLDNEEKCIYFIEDRAFVLMNNEEPLELTFKDEKRTVYIEGVANPITLGFEGKSVEFQIDGRSHILRFGIPGRELFINNHPYEVQFGGPPIAVRLDDGHVHKIHLSGPSPQVVIGSEPQYELFAKYHGNVKNSVYKQEPDHTSEENKSKTQYINPESSYALDIDMRMINKNVQQSDILLSNDSPFYSKDMKDVDWRHIPSSTNLESDKNIPSVFDDDHSMEFETWSQKDNDNRTAHFNSIKNQDSSAYLREASHKHNQPNHFEDNNAPTSYREGNWYYKEQYNAKWQYNDYSENNHRSHCDEHFSQTMRNPSSSDATQNYQDQMEHYESSSNSYIPYSNMSSFQNKPTRGQDCGSSYGTWTSNIDELKHNESLNKLQTSNSTIQQKALLPSPPFPPAYPSLVITSVLPESTSKIALSEIPGKPTTDLPCSTAYFGSEIKQSQSSSSDLTVDVESLLEKLIRTGIINTKPQEQTIECVKSAKTALSEIADIKESDESVEIPEIKLTAEVLKVHHTGVISALHKGLQCATCGMRFKELQCDQYSRHLDWHFRMNRKEKDSSKKAVSKRWYYEVVDWIQFEEFEDFEERVPSYFELQVGNPEPEVEETPTVISVSAANDDQESCPVCNERFQLFWVEEEEEWHFRDAVRHDKVTYHPSCYEDFKKTIFAESNTSDLVEITEDVNEVLNALVDDVVIKIEMEFEVINELEPSNSLKIMQRVPSVDVHSEEELLEGKPGEEEIIGVISESDMETEISMEHSIPTVDSKIIVMQSGGITLKVKAESLQCNPVSNSETEIIQDEDKPVLEEEIDFRPPTPDPNFEVRPLVSKGRELSGLCCIM